MAKLLHFLLKPEMAPRRHFRFEDRRQTFVFTEGHYKEASYQVSWQSDQNWRKEGILKSWTTDNRRTAPGLLNVGPELKVRIRQKVSLVTVKNFDSPGPERNIGRIKYEEALLLHWVWTGNSLVRLSLQNIFHFAQNWITDNTNAKINFFLRSEKLDFCFSTLMPLFNRCLIKN